LVEERRERNRRYESTSVSSPAAHLGVRDKSFFCGIEKHGWEIVAVSE
jgi:hypothetical protein